MFNKLLEPRIEALGHQDDSILDTLMDLEEMCEALPQIRTAKGMTLLWPRRRGDIVWLVVKRSLLRRRRLPSVRRWSYKPLADAGYAYQNSCNQLA